MVRLFRWIHFRLALSCYRQTPFYENGSVYDQLLILDSYYEVDSALLTEQDLPFYAATWVINLLATNPAMAATLTHLLLWNRSDLKGAWSWATPTALKNWWATFNWKFWKDDGMREQSSKDEKDVDLHYRGMLKVRSLCEVGIK